MGQEHEPWRDPISPHQIRSTTSGHTSYSRLDRVLYSDRFLNRRIMSFDICAPDIPAVGLD